MCCATERASSLLVLAVLRKGSGVVRGSGRYSSHSWLTAQKESADCVGEGSEDHLAGQPGSVEDNVGAVDDAEVDTCSAVGNGLDIADGETVEWEARLGLAQRTLSVSYESSSSPPNKLA